MGYRIRPARSATALALGLALALSACGGGGSSDGSAKTTVVAPGPGGSSTTSPSIDLGGGTPSKHAFKKVTGSKGRFIDLLVVDGKGADMDVYWGRDADTGKKAATVKYGEVSDWKDLMVDKDAYLTPADGSTEVSVVFYLAGKTDQKSRIIDQDEPVDGQMRLTYTMGWSKPFDSTVIPGSLGVGFEHKASKAPAGKAWVAFNTSGISGIEGGDFMSLNGPGACQDLASVDLGDTANAGPAYLFDPGTVAITASDANSDCSFKTPPVSLDLKAGDRYILYAYGTSKDDRKLLPVKIGE